MSLDDPRFSDQRMLRRDHLRADPTYWCETSPNGVVATAHYRATAAGVEMLALGGNAVDTAIAVSLALGVCEPAGSGLGGNAMMLIHNASSGRTIVLDGACPAPKRATPRAVRENGKRYRGYGAVAVPTNAAVLAYARQRYATLPLHTLIAPAIRLAEEGYLLTGMQRRLIRRYRSKVRSGPASPVFMVDRKHAQPVGTRIMQPALAATLRRLADAGLPDFYTGQIGRRVAEDMHVNCGFLHADDLAEIPWPRVTEPIAMPFDGSEVRTLGPPGGGTALAQMLRMYACAGSDLPPDTPNWTLHVAGIIRRARSDRRRYRMRSGARDLNDAAELLSETHARRATRKLVSEIGGPGETSHASIIDRHGNAVAITQSIERSFGSGAMTTDLGFFYNGFLRTFKIENERHPHYLRPGAVARSNAVPTIVIRDGQPVGAFGSTGSERMASGVFQVLLRLKHQTPFEAVHAPRLHCTPQRQVYVEAERFDAASLSALHDRGFTIHAYDAYSFKVGGLQLAVGGGDGFCGVADPRRDGAAAGPRHCMTA
jgi:gamma-glutamyltranspeptidase/glutathione hydrolase